MPAQARPDHLLIVYQAPEVIVRRHRGPICQTDRFVTGDVGIYPAGEYGPISSNGPVDNIMMVLPAQALTHFAETRLNLGGLDLIDHFRVKDPLISAIGQALMTREQPLPSIEPLYIRSLTDALCYHLVEHRAVKTKWLRPETGKLSAVVLTRIDAFLEHHLDGLITVDMLADIANCSVFHFSRLFKNTTGRSPYQYVLRHKAERAKTWLRTGTAPIGEIAFRLGFSSPGHFDRFFRQQTGQTPLDFRRDN